MLARGVELGLCWLNADSSPNVGKRPPLACRVQKVTSQSSSVPILARAKDTHLGKLLELFRARSHGPLLGESEGDQAEQRFHAEFASLVRPARRDERLVRELLRLGKPGFVLSVRDREDLDLECVDAKLAARVLDIPAVFSGRVKRRLVVDGIVVVVTDCDLLSGEGESLSAAVLMQITFCLTCQRAEIRNRRSRRKVERARGLETDVDGGLPVHPVGPKGTQEDE